MEGLTLSTKEQNRLHILNGVLERHWTMKEAAPLLGVSPNPPNGQSLGHRVESMVLEQKPARKQGAPNRCCGPIASSLTNRLVANAGLLLPATLARHLGLRELVDHHLDLGGAPGRANTGDKMLTLVASAGRASTTPRAGGTVGVLGAWSRRLHPGEQRERPTRRLAPAIDLDSTTLDKEGARHHGYTGARGYHPLLAIAAGTGHARGPGQHRPPTSCVRVAVRADSGTGVDPLLYHHPPARQPAGPDRGDTRGGLDSHSLLDGRRRRCRRDDLHPVPDHAAPVPHCPSRRRFPPAITPSSDGETWNADHRRHADGTTSPPTAPGWRSR